MHHPALDPPLLTPDLPGVGGQIRVRPEDFEVEEIPSYLPCGTGEHLYLWVEKREVGPEFFSRTIAQRLGVPVGSVGTAGLKDRHAVTRQWVSVPAEAESRIGKVDGEGIRVLKHDRHANKLKPGHLKGNSFRILIRGADATKAPTLDAIRTRLRDQGLPNYYGPQRFGRDGSTLDLGFRCLAGTQSRRVRPFQYKFALSAVQSLLFNDYLGRRLRDGLFRTVLLGDVMAKRETGGLFVVQDVPAEQARFDSKETLHCGPMFGKRTFAAEAVAAEREAAVLAANNLSVAAFDGFGKLMSGTRRHNLVDLTNLQAEWKPEGLQLVFDLPAGSYATVLLREVMKLDPERTTPTAEDAEEVDDD
jgi:tRNA pseudouridine13 synthase